MSFDTFKRRSLWQVITLGLDARSSPVTSWQASRWTTRLTRCFRPERWASDEPNGIFSLSFSLFSIWKALQAMLVDSFIVGQVVFLSGVGLKRPFHQTLFDEFTKRILKPVLRSRSSHRVGQFGIICHGQTGFVIEMRTWESIFFFFS